MTASKVAQWIGFPVCGAVLVWRFGSRPELLMLGIGVFVLVAVLAIPLVMLGVMVAAVLKNRMRPFVPVSVPLHDVDPEHRAILEGQVYEVIRSEPGWRLIGWMRVETNDALIAGNGVSFLFAIRDKHSGAIMVTSQHGDERPGAALYPTGKFFTMSGMDPEDLALVGQPPHLLLPLHRAQMAGLTLTPVPDPIAFIRANAAADFLRTNSRPGRRIDAEGNGRYTLWGAIRTVARFVVRGRLAARENEKALAILAGERPPYQAPVQAGQTQPARTATVSPIAPAATAMVPAPREHGVPTERGLPYEPTRDPGAGWAPPTPR